MRKSLFYILFLMVVSTATAFAADYKILVVSDNITAKPSVDAMIYEDSAEFFANQVINKLNLSGTIEAPTISIVRDKLSRNPRLAIATRDAMATFKKGYNINYANAQKLGLMFGTDKVLLITTSADAQNYFMRRTFWDFLNIPGASVIDPAIKLSTYAVLIDTNRMVNLWEDTFYKTISTCESRMVANSLGPQTQQLEKVRDYSRMLAPQIASNVQLAIVPKSRLNYKNEITYGPKDFDNILTKKYRWYKKSAKNIIKDADYQYTNRIETERANGIEPLSDKARRKRSELIENYYQRKTEFAQYREERRRIKAENARLKQIQKEQILEQKKLEKEQEQHIQDVKNEVEINDIKPIEPKPAVEIKKPEKKKSEPKVLNISKDEILEEKPVVEKVQYQYYKPTKHMPVIKNTTINDI